MRLELKSISKKTEIWLTEHRDDIILFVGGVLISLFSFAVGYILAKQQEKEPIKFEQHESSYYRSGSQRPLPGLEIS